MNGVNKSYFKSKLSKVKNLGNVGSGTKEWLHQRLSALMLVIFSLWFVVIVIRILKSKAIEVSQIISSPSNSIIFCIFTLVALYHGKIGIKEVIIDYIHCRKMKAFSLIALNFFVIISAITFIFAVLMFHISVCRSIL